MTISKAGISLLHAEHSPVFPYSLQARKEEENNSWNLVIFNRDTTNFSDLFYISRTIYSTRWSPTKIFTSYNHFCRVENSRVYKVWCLHRPNGNHNSHTSNSLRARTNSMLSKRTDPKSVCHIWHKNAASHRTIQLWLRSNSLLEKLCIFCFCGFYT